jgi:hypothetical protein
MVERSLLFLWADVQVRKFVQERNFCVNPNICALKSHKKSNAAYHFSLAADNFVFEK